MRRVSGLSRTSSVTSGNHANEDYSVRLPNSFHRYRQLILPAGDVKELERQSPHNWLDDNFWLKKAYHEWRAPLIINSNWWLAFADDPSVPYHVRHPVDAQRGYTKWQVRRASWLVHRVLDFKVQLEQLVRRLV